MKDFFKTTKRFFPAVLVLGLVGLFWQANAQITRTQADTIVQNHLQNENVQYDVLYVSVNAPSAAGIVLTTSNKETFSAKYACWTYYLKENGVLRCRYLFVKQDNGNLLEVIATNDLGQQDSTQWKAVENNVGIPTITNYELRIFPNPTNGQLRITNYELRENTVVEIFSIAGQVVQQSPVSVLSPETTIDISHLANGLYFLKIDNKVVKIIKY